MLKNDLPDTVLTEDSVCINNLVSSKTEITFSHLFSKGKWTTRCSMHVTLLAFTTWNWICCT